MAIVSNKFESVLNNSMQSIANMPSLSPRHLLPSIPQIVHIYPKYEQFEVKLVPKCVKSTDRDQNVITSEDGKDTTSMQNPRILASCVPQEVPRTPKVDPFH